MIERGGEPSVVRLMAMAREGVKCFAVAPDHRVRPSRQHDAPAIFVVALHAVSETVLCHFGHLGWRVGPSGTVDEPLAFTVPKTRDCPSSRRNGRTARTAGD